MTTNPPPATSIADVVNPMMTAVPQMAEISTDETVDSSHLTTLPEERVPPPSSNLDRQLANTNRLVESMLSKFDGLDRRMAITESSLSSLSFPGASSSAPAPTGKVFREVLGQLGSSVDKVIHGLTEADLEDSQPLLPSPDVETTVDRSVPSISVASNSSSSSRFRPCKPEYLPTYDGNPLELEKYLGRIGGILRTDPDEAWELAVLRSMPIRFSGDAEEWHSGMSPADAKRIVTFSDMAEAMRKEFRANRSEQRRLARARVWMPTAEPVATFYHVKLRALRVASGQDQTDSVLVEDIVDSLPPTFRAMMRLPRIDPMLDDLRAELGTWEDTWRQIHPQFALRPAVTPPVAMSSTPPRRSPAASTAPTAASTSAPSAPTPVRADQPPARNGPPLASTYDPSRVIPAADGKLRQYRRPHDNVLIELRHPCTRCGQDHFNFEYTHLDPAVRVMEVDDDDYPEVNLPAEGESF
ncbi:hypothetical protein A4X06_0g4011 [Tilletia controversa]|uniref:Uncharacterized protein n=1 Tax=Tilletia controversa TaxID=13291 RepID=A0A8X7MUA2_9BASI|nr:hypothetical protein A4X06_0g4011 [Tilletia controversa]